MRLIYEKVETILIIRNRLVQVTADSQRGMKEALFKRFRVFLLLVIVPYYLGKLIRSKRSLPGKWLWLSW